VNVDTYAMANLIARTKLVPELIQEECTAARIVQEALSLVVDRDRRASVIAGLREVRNRLAMPGASGRAADAVLSVARAPVTR
jgi:lipid-A-disaccharide synthase